MFRSHSLPLALRKEFCFGMLLALMCNSVSRGAVTINWIPVGNSGNAADPATGSHYGAVNYSYNIASYDVTDSQYVEFLNAKDPTGANTLGLYNSNMSSATYGGITYSAGGMNGSKYSVMSGRGNHPVNYATWYDAVRFANWLNDGQGTGDTENGAYALAGGTPTPSNGLSVARSLGAHVFIPNENEWYKAAYYNSASSSYFQYPTSSNTTPTATGPTAVPNSANYAPGGPLNMTDVGAYMGTTSPYGAFDMGGNVWQWDESLITPSTRGIRGGSFGYNSSTLLASTRFDLGPTNEFGDYGFRVAEFLPGDLNRDGFVGQNDLNLILSHWGQTVTAGDFSQGDWTGDGFVGQGDLNAVLADWGAGTPPSASTPTLVPEPSSLVLIGLALVGLIGCGLRHRQR